MGIGESKGEGMTETFQELGRVKLVQVQPDGLIIESPSGYTYDASRLVEVERLTITSSGIEATTPGGERVLDIHHLDHPGKKYGKDDLVSIGFTAHYQAMRSRFGEHMVDGIAGENIIIEYEGEVWLEDLGEHLAIEEGASGRMARFEVVKYASPCEEFSHFAASSQDKKLPTAELKSTLQFLGNGRRGFLLLFSPGQEPVSVRAGDRVFAIRP